MKDRNIRRVEGIFMKLVEESRRVADPSWEMDRTTIEEWRGLEKTIRYARECVKSGQFPDYSPLRGLSLEAFDEFMTESARDARERHQITPLVKQKTRN